MMKALYIACYTVLRNFRDFKTLALMILLPIILIAVLGSALSSIFTPEGIGATHICYLDEDGGFMPELFEAFISSEEISDMLKVKEVASRDEAFAIIEAGKASALVVFPGGFSEKVQKGSNAFIEVYNSKYSSLRESIIVSMLNGFVNSTNAKLVLSQMGSGLEYKLYENIMETAVTAEGNSPRAIDYYAVTMLAMTIMYGTSFGNYAVKEEKLLNTNTRLASAPVTYMEIVSGKLLGSIVTIFLQSVILVLFTKAVYKANWGGKLGFILFVCFSGSLMAVGLGMMVSNLGRNPYVTGSLLNLGVSVMTFLAGGYYPASQMGPAFEKLGHISPNYLVQQSIFNTIYGGSADETRKLMLAIWSIVLISMLIAGLTIRRGEN